MKKLILLILLLIPNLVMGEDISWSSDCTSTNCGATIDGNDTVTGVGNIVTTVDSAHAIYLNSSSSNTINLIGNLSTSENTANGIFLNGVSASNNIRLIGDITVSGTNSNGILLFRGVSPNYDIQDNIFNITGNILATGPLGNGYVVEDAHSTIISQTGNITTTGNSAEAFAIFTGVENTVTINGNITTSGSSSHALALSEALGSNFTVNGNITTNDVTAYGIKIYSNSDDNVITVNGNINNPSSGYAIHIDSTSDNNTIYLNRGNIAGSFYNDGSNNKIFFNGLGESGSYIFTTEGASAFLLTDSNKPVVYGSAKSRGVADMDDAGNRLYQRLSQINSSLTTQHRELAQGEVRGDYWIDSYYTDSERDTVLQEVNQNTRGITVGFNASGDRDLAMDVVINYENSDADYGLSDQTVDANSLMVGLSFPELMKARNGSLAVKFLTGLSNNDRDLKVLNNLLATGQETVTDKYDSTYVTAGAEWMQPLYKGEHVQHDVLLGMDINHEQIEGSTASAYYRLDDRDITQLVGQAQYGVTITGINEKLKINGSVGVSHANIIDGEKQHYTIDGTAVNYTADKSNTYTTATLGATYRLNPQAYAYAHVKRFDSTDDIDGTTGNVGLVVRF